MALNECSKQVIFQANPNAVSSMKEIREQLHKLGQKYAHRPVRIQTIDGIQYEGTITGMNGGILYLSLPAQPVNLNNNLPFPYGGLCSPRPEGYPEYTSYDYGYASYDPTTGLRSFYGGVYYNNVILPLVLYELLVISLLSS